MRSPGPIGGDLLARRYRLIDRVGAGGMSVVWRARDEVLDRLVAVKWLGSELADDSLFQDLVRREAWATARIKHPAVAAVYDYGEVATADGTPRAYVVMEMLDGESLSERLRRGPVPWPQAVAICAEVADALATAHDNGVVHRDISPDNVMLTSSGIRVFDFGIAAPIGEPDDDATGSTFGTPAYVAPERLDGQPAQTATDVYSLGVLLFEMLTGRPPFPEDTWNADAALTERSAPRPKVAGLPHGVGTLCQRCLSHDPAGRPSAHEVAGRLRGYGRAWWPGRIAVAGTAAACLAGAIAMLVTWSPNAPLALQGAGPTGSAPVVVATAGPSSTAGAPPLSASGPPPATGHPSPAAPPPYPSVTGPAGSPGPTAPTPTLTVDQALSALRNTIDTSVPTGLDSDLAQDLRNSVDNISTTLAASPGADVSTAIRGLQRQIMVRSGDRNADGSLRMTTATRTALLQAVAQLNSALGYPPLQ